MKNPYVYLHEIKERSIFAGRREQISIIEKEISNFVNGQPLRTMAIVGRRRIGKTSLLYRIIDLCKENKVIPVIFEIKDQHIKDQWQFWYELLGKIISSCAEMGILQHDLIKPLTFWEQNGDNRGNTTSCHLRYEQYYEDHNKSEKGFTYPSVDIIGNDIKSIIDDYVSISGHKGIIIIFDEAQIVQKYKEGIDIKQTLRDLISRETRMGLVLAGLENLGTMFTVYEDPFYQRGHLIPLENFKQTNEIIECILLTLNDDEKKLVSTMTVNYISHLSQGMPNFIQLICFAIYQRYLENKQKDLNITIDVLDDILDLMEKDASVQGDLRKVIDNIKALNSAELEILYDLTRYPGWNIDEVVDLDESFRGEVVSKCAKQRRIVEIEDRRQYFIERELMANDPQGFILYGDEYAHLYLRFWYEVMKYGKLSETIVVGQKTQTTFGEKADKLAEAIGWEIKYKTELETRPGIRLSMLHEDVDERGEMVVERVISRYQTFEKFKKGEKIEKDDFLEMFLGCLEVCQLVESSGKYLMVCFALRNRERPRELIHIELYFGMDEWAEPSLGWTSLSKQAEEAKISIEGTAITVIELPEINELLEKIGVNLEDYVKKLDMVQRWRINCIQHMLTERKKRRENKEDAEKEEKILDGKWLELYSKDRTKEAVALLESKLLLSKERHIRARFHNDLGYIRSGQKNQKNNAIKELELAFDYHYNLLTLTILNISYINILMEDYPLAIKRINDVLILTHSRQEIEVGYLRTLLPRAHLPFIRHVWENHPANILEVSYIQLAYATFKYNEDNFEKAIEIINEGLELLPSSIWLKHALARYSISRKRVDLAIPLYKELSKLKIPDEALNWEISQLLKSGKN